VVLAGGLLEAQGMSCEMAILGEDSVEVRQVEGLSLHLNKIILSHNQQNQDGSFIFN
jgi:hypothetical protein